MYKEFQYFDCCVNFIQHNKYYTTNVQQLISFINEAVTDDSFPETECYSETSTEWKVSVGIQIVRTGILNMHS